MTFCLAADHDLIAILPFVYKLRNHFYGILEISANRNGAVTFGIDDSIVRTIELAKVFDIKDRLYMLILSTNTFDDLPCPILRLIVNKQDLIIIIRTAFDPFVMYGLINRSGILFLIISIPLRVC